MTILECQADVHLNQIYHMHDHSLFSLSQSRYAYVERDILQIFIYTKKDDQSVQYMLVLFFLNDIMMVF